MSVALNDLVCPHLPEASMIAKPLTLPALHRLARRWCPPTARWDRIIAHPRAGWGSAADLDDGYEVCECYIPTTDREYYGDGLMIVGRHRLDTKDRDEARARTLQLTTNAIADHELRHPRAA